MSANTAKAGLTYPSLSDAPNVPSSIQTIASQLDGMVIPKYASSSAQATANPSPTAGDMCFRSDLNAYQQYDGSEWDSLTTGSWMTYTPTWTGLSALGASTSYGRYIQIGRTVHCTVGLFWGTGSTLGTGAITVSLPIPATVATTADLGWQGLGKYRDNLTVWYPLYGFIEPGGTVIDAYAANSSTNGIQSPGAAGFSWSTTYASMRLQITYETA